MASQILEGGKTRREGRIQVLLVKFVQKVVVTLLIKGASSLVR